MKAKKFLLFSCLFFSFNNFASENNIIINFGSCYKQNDSENVFSSIKNKKPDAFFWLGDIIYADYFSPKKRRSAYNKIKSKPAYNELKNSTLVDGTWDDHDYAFNNAGGGYEEKEKSKELLLEFLEIEKNSAVYDRAGVYHKRNLQKGNLSIDTLFLDTRSFMNTKKDQLLGEEQWRWLKESLYESNADLIIIASSISVLSPVSRFLFWIEGWHQFKREKTKLVEFIDTLNKKLILISGDRHYSDVSRVPLRNRRFLYEFMSSGMSKTSRPMSSHLRINSPISILNFSTLEIKKDFNGVIDINHQINTVITGRLIQRNIIKI